MKTLFFSNKKHIISILTVVILGLVLSVGEYYRVENVKTEYYQNGFNQGRSEGYDEGKQDGYKRGKEDGYNEGYSYGSSRGQSAGYSRGYSAAQVRTISCIHCGGRGVKTCFSCNGEGCGMCGNTGLEKCFFCDGRGWDQY